MVKEQRESIKEILNQIRKATQQDQLLAARDLLAEANKNLAFEWFKETISVPDEIIFLISKNIYIRISDINNTTDKIHLNSFCKATMRLLNNIDDRYIVINKEDYYNQTKELGPALNCIFKNIENKNKKTMMNLFECVFENIEEYDSFRGFFMDH